MRGNLLGLWTEVRTEKRGPCVKGGDSPLNPPHLPEMALSLPDVSAAWTQEIGLPSDKAEPLLCLKLPLFMK